MTRKLTLKKDTLTELSQDELAGVVGGITTLLLFSLQDCHELDTTPTLPAIYCVANQL